MNPIRTRHGLALCAALLLGACASALPQPQSVRDPNAPWASYATYGWSPAPAVDGTDQPLLLLDRNIRSAIAAEMQRRGYTESANPDLRITYETTSKPPARMSSRAIPCESAWASAAGAGRSAAR